MSVRDYKFQNTKRTLQRSLGNVVFLEGPGNPRAGPKKQGTAPPAMDSLMGGDRVAIGYNGAREAGSAE